MGILCWKSVEIHSLRMLDCDCHWLFQIIWYRTYIARDRLQIASVVLLGIAALCSLRFLLPGSVAHDQLLDSERYT